jgi:hypothetical protein
VELSTAEDDTLVETVGDGEIEETTTLVDATIDEFDMLEADEPTREDVFTAKEELKLAATDEEVILGAEVELLLETIEELKSAAIDEEVILGAEIEWLLEEELEADTTDEEVQSISK